MRRFKNVLKGGLCFGIAFSLMLSCAACGKEEAVVEEYGGETASVTEASADSTETVTESTTVQGYGLTEMLLLTYILSGFKSFSLE